MRAGSDMETLAVIVPVYNEEAVIRDVLLEWANTLGGLGIDYHLHVYNDGSKDGTACVIEETARDNERIIPHTKANSGHGPTILLGYAENCSKYTWLFQTDSDNELPAEAFGALWAKRKDYDFLICTRDSRVQPLPRKLISLFSRLTVRVFYGRTVWDVNSPFRLMRSQKFVHVFPQIPEKTFAPNVVVSGMVGLKQLPYYECFAKHTHRATGVVSLKKWKLLKSVFFAFYQTITIRFMLSK